LKSLYSKGSDGNDHLAICISLQEIMNFTYTVIKPPDGQYGAIQPDGTWSGMVKLLANHDIDIATASFMVTQQRSTVITFASPISDAYSSLFIKNPADIFNIMAYIEPMQWLAWVGIFVFLATVPPLLYLAVR
jgi:ionotropic kainate glutamate receptor 5